MGIPFKYQRVTQKIIEAAEGRLKFGAIKKGAIRFNRVNPKEELLDLFEILSKSHLDIWMILPPKLSKSASSKFLTYWVHCDLTWTQYALVFAVGGNKGHHFESHIEENLQQSISSEKPNTNPLLINLAKYEAVSFNILSNNFPVKAYRSSGSPPKRFISLDLVDIGSKIADVTLKLKNGENVYLSLKNKQGNTFSNNGISKSFGIDENGRIIPTLSKADSIFCAFGIDKDRITQGCSYYQSKNYYSKWTDYNPLWQPESVLTYIRSGFGFGYWYVREQGLDQYQIINLTTLNHLCCYIPCIELKQISYPYYHTETDKSKQCSVDLKVNTTEYPMSLRVEIRNTKGAVIPTELKILKK